MVPARAARHPTQRDSIRAYACVWPAQPSLTTVHKPAFANLGLWQDKHPQATSLAKICSRTASPKHVVFFINTVEVTSRIKTQQQKPRGHRRLPRAFRGHPSTSRVATPPHSPNPPETRHPLHGSPTGCVSTEAFNVPPVLLLRRRCHWPLGLQECRSTGAKTRECLNASAYSCPTLLKHQRAHFGMRGVAGILAEGLSKP